jgi:hypothetical protein
LSPAKASIKVSYKHRRLDEFRTVAVLLPNPVSRQAFPTGRNDPANSSSPPFALFHAMNSQSKTGMMHFTNLALVLSADDADGANNGWNDLRSSVPSADKLDKC